MTEYEMNRRRFVVGGSASAVTLAMAGLATRQAVHAQDATPAPSPDTKTSRYDLFVAALAAALGSGDATAVDAAIRTALKQLVDDEFAAGNISANEATARKEQIDTAASPLGTGGIGGGRGGRHDGRGKDGVGGNGRRDDDARDPGATDPGSTDPATEATPSTL
jgi:hypothetical protein